MSFIDYGKYLEEIRNFVLIIRVPKNPVSAISNLLLVRTRSCSLFDHIFHLILGNSKVNIYKCSAHEPRVIIMLLYFVLKIYRCKKGVGFSLSRFDMIHLLDN